MDANSERVLTGAAEMDVRVVETGHDEVAAEIDDASSLFGECGDFVFVTDDENFFATYEHGGSPWCLRVVGIDAGVFVKRDGGVFVEADCLCRRGLRGDLIRA